MFFDERQELVDVIARLDRKGFLPGKSGDLSLRCEENRVLVTPDGLSKARLTPEQMVLVDLAGDNISGQGRTNAELPLHLFIYSVREEIKAVIHIHPPI